VSLSWLSFPLVIPDVQLWIWKNLCLRLAVKKWMNRRMIQGVASMCRQILSVTLHLAKKWIWFISCTIIVNCCSQRLWAFFDDGVSLVMVAQFAFNMVTANCLPLFYFLELLYVRVGSG
jgi:hypothetical protein